MSKHDWLGLFAIIFMILAMATMPGCSVSGWHINKAIESCKDHGGTDYINPAFGIQCNDGQVFGLVRKT